MKVVLVDCLIYQGLLCYQERRAAGSPDRDEPITTRMKRAHGSLVQMKIVMARVRSRVANRVPELAEQRRRSSKRTAPLEQLTDPHRSPPAVTARD
jgi:hypothetical protein